MTRVLVTGGAGFIGSNFTRHLAARRPDWEIVVLDKLTYAGRRENLADLEGRRGCSFVQCDIADRQAVAAVLPGCAYVVNFAAETHVDRSLYDAGSFIQTDVYGTFVLLEEARRASDLKMFVQISTDEVYGSVESASSRETDALAQVRRGRHPGPHDARDPLVGMLGAQQPHEVPPDEAADAGDEERHGL